MLLLLLITMERSSQPIHNTVFFGYDRNELIGHKVEMFEELLSDTTVIAGNLRKC